MKRGRPRHRDILTPREWQVLELIRLGLTNERIGTRLGISESGAKYHVAEILSKLGVATREEAAAWSDARFRWPSSRSMARLPFALAGKAAAAGGVAAGVVVLAVLAAGVLFNHHASAVAPGPLGKVAYIQAGDVWVKALPDGTPQRLTSQGDIALPSWSPSGEWLRYVKGSSPKFEVWVIRSDGGSRHRIDTPTPSALWSPADDKLTYFGRNGALVVEDADGGNRHEVVTPYQSATEAGGLAGAGLAWSPDGKWLAYGFERWPAPPASATPVPSRTPLPYPTPSGPERTYAGIWRVAPDGSGAAEVLQAGADPHDGFFVAGWSPDSRFVLFAPLPGFAGEPGSQDAGSIFRDGLSLWAVPADGGAARDLGVSTQFGLAGTSAAAADLSRFAAVIGRGQETWTNKGIAVVDVALGTVAPLTPAGATGLSPAWSPDGGWIAYVGSVDAGATGQAASFASRRIWLTRPDGSEKRPLTNTAGRRDEAPRWSNDGTHILFARMSPDACGPATYSLELLNVGDGSVVEVLTELPLSGSHDELLQIGQVPTCPAGSGGWISDNYGGFSSLSVYDWWQPRK